MKKTPYVLYEDIPGSCDSREQLSIHIPSGNGFTCYSFGHVVNGKINADSWRIIESCSRREDGHRQLTLTDGGEWEMAIRLEGRPDFMGGSNHGNEVAEEIVFSIDGESFRPSDITGRKPFSELCIYEKTSLFDPSFPSARVAVHEKNYVFTDRGLALTQTVDWLTACDVTCAYMAMLPVIRAEGWNNRLTITGADSRLLPTEYALSEDGASPALGQIHGVLAAEVSSDAGFRASIRPTRLPSFPGGNLFFITSSPNRNKLYFMSTNPERKHITAIGERWTSETHYALTLR